MKKLLWISLAILFLALQACDIDEPDDSLDGNYYSETEAQILTLVNEYRLSEGLKALTMDSVIWRYATEHNNYQINLEDINHDNFSERIENLIAEIGGGAAAENVAMGYESPEAVVQGWISSEGHRLNMLGDYNLTGISAKKSSAGDWYYCQIFLNK